MVSQVADVFFIIQIIATIARRIYNQYVLLFAIAQGRIDPIHMGRIGLAKAGIDDLGAIVHRITNGPGDVLIVLISIRNGSENHQFYL